MSKMRKWYVVLIALAVIAVAWGIGARIFMANKSTPVSPLATVSLAYYTNAQGRQWAIPTGEDKFTVTSQETYPKFVLGNVNPVKVAIGDTQIMQIVVRDNVPLTKVWAEVENDKSTDTIPLALGASSTVSYNTIEDQKYLVNNDGALVINDGTSKNSAIADLIQSLFTKASAEQAVDYFYSGKWIVHDTRTVTYHTTFYAMDAQGRTAQLTLAWSDPCKIGTGSSLLAPCSLTDTWGYEGGSLSLGGQTVTLSASTANLVYNGGASGALQIGTGKVALNTSGAQMSRGHLYFPDADGDGWAATTTMTTNSSGGVLVTSVHANAYDTTNDSQVPATSSLDCNDSDAHANPGDTAWWADSQSTGWSGVPAGNFNCDGTLGAYINLYNSGYQTSGYPGIYNGSSYVSMNKVSLSLATAYCYYNSSNVAIGLYVSSGACGSVYNGSSNIFWYDSSGTNLPTTCGSSVAWGGGPAVQVCK